jgi:uncharacterized damage-inducible protein DinB
MEMKEYLIETFQFNDRANLQTLESIEKLPDKEEAVRFFSHLINSQKKWLARIIEYPNNPKMDWWKPAYSFDKLKEEWNSSLQAWIRFLETKKEEELFNEVSFIGFDGGQWTAKLKDIALQLNYHNIHHRAQIQMMIRAQGIEPQFVDYIASAYRKLE